MNDKTMDQIDAILGEKRAWIDALVVENGNQIAGPFRRHVPTADEPRVLCSHPFALVVTEDGCPRWTLQMVDDRTSAMAYHTLKAVTLRLSAEDVASRRDWLAKCEANVKAALTNHGVIKGEVWSADTLAQYNERVREAGKKLEAIGA
jgi:hypothetical protein